MYCWVVLSSGEYMCPPPRHQGVLVEEQEDWEKSDSDNYFEMHWN